MTCELPKDEFLTVYEGIGGKGKGGKIQYHERGKKKRHKGTRRKRRKRERIPWAPFENARERETERHGDKIGF